MQYSKRRFCGDLERIGVSSVLLVSSLTKFLDGLSTMSNVEGNYSRIFRPVR